ncbi:MAG: hypothetical protein PHD17_11305 [Methanothrix soehngenii]|jgi:hypothetical protein|nr:hypothetical protein [Candidatus Methanomethylophilaceae archaeon]MDD3975257.1 hypothetical protein [Methanothrix soehngenii]
MAVKRETLITARNQNLKDSRVPLNAVVATRTNPARGRIAWVTDTLKNPWYREAWLGGRSRHPPQYAGQVAQYQKGKLVKIVDLTYRSLEDAKKGMDFWVNKSE